MDEQIKDHERIIIKLKRARNALLGISTLPPEVLGDIFRRNVSLEELFGGLEEGSRNFLLVCHHWFEVALRTPEVWSFWGNTPKHWARWYRRSQTAPLDLVLGGVDYDDGSFDATLRDALRDRAARDTIRRVHLWSGDAEFLSSIISPLAAACDGVRSNSVESFILSNDGDTPVDVSDFFAHYTFPKLQRLLLDDCKVASWDFLTSRTAVLTTLILNFSHPSPTPTTSQLLSILASNPTLRIVTLSSFAVPDDGGGESSFRVPLHHLKGLELAGTPRNVIKLLHRLDHPRNMDDLNITLSDCPIAGISQIIGPYLRDYLRRRGRSQGGLGLLVSLSGRRVTLNVGDADGIDLSTPAWKQMATFVGITMELDQTPKELLYKGVLDLIAHVPQDEIVYFRTWSDPLAMDDLFTRLPNLKALHTVNTPLLAVFPESNLDGDEKIFPSLRHVFLEQLVVSDGDWTPLMGFLARLRVSSGNQLDSLTVVDSPHMCPEVMRRIRGMVQEFKVDRMSRCCPFAIFGFCPEQCVVATNGWSIHL